MLVAKPGELLMAASNLNIQTNGEQIVYPEPGNTGALAGGTVFGATDTAADSAVLGSDRDALIYSIEFQGSPGGGANSTRIFLERHDGTRVMNLRSGNIGQLYEFGPEGLRLPDFRIRFPVVLAGDPDMTVTIAYQID